LKKPVLGGRLKRSLIIITVIIATAILLSLISYHFYQSSALQILEISKRNTRTNAEIQAFDLANSLSNKLGDISTLLQVISASRSVQEGNVSRASAIINEAQFATSDLADFYMWLDKDGKVVWISNLNDTAYQQYRGLDLSYRLYFSEPKRTDNVYYSSVVDSNDGIERLYITYPVLRTTRIPFLMPHEIPPGIIQNHLLKNPSVPTHGDFQGIIVAGIRTDQLGKYLESQISPNLKSQVGLTDNTIGSEAARTMSSSFKQGLIGQWFN
jgi:hypothetical protein